jgi:hypothetical protein
MYECVGGLRLFRVAGCLILLLAAAPFLSAQNVINVPADQPTIQAAINAANNGDTVLVAPGKYVENINFGGKAITLTSSGGPSVTTIDGGAHGSVVTFNSSETASSKLNGFTITDGLQNGYWGGGLFISGASPTITGNVITGNHAAVGIGIYVNGGSPLIQNNTITGNDQKGAGDGGQGGGGILVEGNGVTAPQIIGNAITNNSVGNGGNGGGISIFYASGPLIQNNLIQGNTAYNDGGGMSVWNSGAIVVQNLIINNAVLGYYSGGGIWVSPSSSGSQPIFINNTIAGNRAVDSTSGLFVTGFGQNATFTNNIVLAITGQVAVTCNSIYSSISPVFSYNDAFSSSGQNWSSICDTTSQPGNISTDPQFLSATDFHLQWASPAVDAGNNSAPSLPATDFDGNPRVVDGNADGLAVVDLGAYELSPTTITLAPNSLTFGPQPLGSTSATQTVTLTNTGNQKLLFAMSVSANFAETDNCGSSLAAGASCSINVSFSPTVTGNITGNLTLKDTASGSPQTVALAGTGGAPVASLTPTSLDFGAQPVGTTSAAQTITLSNTGNDAMAISNITSSGDFAETNTCGATLAAAASCSISVTFTPSATGTRSGSVTVVDNASGSPQSVSLTGTGTAPIATASPSTLTFSGQTIGTASPTQSATLSNTGTAPLTISGITITGDFAETNTCGTTLAVGATCTINVTFTPATIGTRSGSVTVTDNASGSPQTVSLTGTGTAPIAMLSPASLAFGGQFVGTTSLAQTTTLSNTGNAPLAISAITSTGNFAQTNTCGTTLGAGARCTISVTFTPTAVGTRTGSVTVTDNASGSPQSVSLAGTGTAPMAMLSPASLSFGSQVIGTTSPAQSATLSNTGTAPLTISAITITGDFAQTNNCGTTLAAATSCTISVSFTPSVTGIRTGSLTVSSNSQGGAVSAALSGSGVENAPVFSPTSLAFSSQIVGTKSGGKDLHLTANGPGPLAISSITVTGPFLESNNCPASLNAGSNCNITINFQPTAGGPATGAIVVTDNGLGSPQTVPLSGNGLDFTLSASPSSVTVSAGYNAQYTVTATEVGGSFNNSVNLSCSGLPAQSQCQFSPGGISPKTGSASSTLTIQTKHGGNGTPAGSYVITIAGTSGSLKHTTTVNLTVN